MRPPVRPFTRILGASVMSAVFLSSMSTPAGTASAAIAERGSPPIIISFSPRIGPVGTLVTIEGDRFTGAKSVTFDGHTAQFSVVNDDRVTAVVPPGATTGKVTVGTPSGSDSSFGDFTVTDDPPAITNFSPRNGPVGTSVMIEGNHFTGATSVAFSGRGAPFSVVNDDRITTTVPADATTGKIRVTTPAGSDESFGAFTVAEDAPVIDNFSPRTGTIGTSVMIEGNHFTGATSVAFSGLGAQFSIVNDDRITASVPSGATTGRIRVTSPAGFDESGGPFTVTGGTHERTVSLYLGGRLLAYGRVVSLDGFAACEANAPVVIKRFRRGEWRWVATTATREDGSYRTYLRDRRGRYRARAKRLVLVDGTVCLGDRSAMALNRSR